jgi:hypothetical protein
MNVETNRPVTIYISAAADLMAEREAVARMIAGLPVSLAWRIMQTPIGEEPLDLETLAAADLYLLVMGGDIRAPVGLEWHTAQRSHRPGRAFLKQGIARTPAGQVFIGQQNRPWQPFQDAADLSRQVRRLLVEHLLEHAVRYQLTPAEFTQLSRLQKEADLSEPSGSGGEAGRSAVILSRERFTPGGGLIVDND